MSVTETTTKTRYGSTTGTGSAPSETGTGDAPPGSEADTEAPSGSWDIHPYMQEEEEASSHDDEPRLRKYARIILPHVGLILISCLYVVIGALVFYSMERPNEEKKRLESLNEIHAAKDRLLQSLWNKSASIDEQKWKAMARIEVRNITKMLFEAFEFNFVTADSVKNNTGAAYQWTMNAAVFFTATLLTTIGYGNLVPRTLAGKVFCICYGLLGVPLILITIADFGKFLSEHIVWLYKKYLRFKKRFGTACGRNTSLPPSPTPNFDQDSLAENADFALYGYVAIPVTLVLVILVGYTALGALILSLAEGWDFFKAFYFSFITMTTVGFGDLVPRNEAYLMLDLLYIVIGLAITTMCIDLVGIQYIRKVHYFGRAIKDARFALINVGGKMVQVGDLVKYAHFLHRKYGSSHEEIGHIIENPLAKLFPNAFIPNDIHYIRYIDYIPGSHESLYNTLQQHILKRQASELAKRLASIDENSNQGLQVYAALHKYLETRPWPPDYTDMNDRNHDP